MEFKSGDKVKKINGETFSNNKYILTVDYIKDGNIWFKETGTNLHKSALEYAQQNNWKEFLSL